MEVDPERLAAAARQLLGAANEMPTPPSPQTITGSDPLSQAIAAQASRVEAPVSEGLPAVQKDAIRNAENVATAAKTYEDTDKRLADDINKRTFPKPDDNLVRAAGFGTFKDAPPPDPKTMTEAEARAAWAAVNADVQAYNARCGRTFVLPNEQAGYSACAADRGPLLERQAAIRARLNELGRTDRGIRRSAASSTGNTAIPAANTDQRIHKPCRRANTGPRWWSWREQPRYARCCCESDWTAEV